ncbi:hypothetical protein M9Y10_034749 [Tritrichomonas musculus]|uniref:Uncharacterized protein n=1 Tax=Tritrichomonas musculus TaxID=1915356 RepID=A0ABR2KFU9_9EUKA
MEGFGDSPLYCNFNPPEKRKTHSKRTPKKSPKSPKTFSSPDPTVKSQVFDSDLVDHETDLNLREEEFLIELKLFYEGIDKYNKLKEEYEEMLRNKQTGRFSLIEFASRLSMYQDMLEQRFDAAQQILTEPLDDIAAQEKLLKKLEQEIDQLNNNLPQELSPDSQNAIDKMMLEIEQINADNDSSRESLRKRQISIESERRKLTNEQIQLENDENEEKRKSVQLKRDQEKLERTPKIDEERAIRDEKFRAELEQRKRETQQKQIEFENKCKASEDSLGKLQTEVQGLLKEQFELSELKHQTDQILQEIKLLLGGQANFTTNLADAEDEIERLKRKIEQQAGDIKKISDKKNQLMKRIAEAEKRKAELLAREEELKKRRSILESTDEQFAKTREENESLKKYIEELNEEVKKYEKLAKDMMAKAMSVQEELDSKSSIVLQTPNANHIEEIQNLLSASETGVNSS